MPQSQSFLKDNEYFNEITLRLKFQISHFRILADPKIILGAENREVLHSNSFCIRHVHDASNLIFFVFKYQIINQSHERKHVIAYYHEI